MLVTFLKHIDLCSASVLGLVGSGADTAVESVSSWIVITAKVQNSKGVG